MKSHKIILGSWSAIAMVTLSIAVVIAVTICCHDAQNIFSADKNNPGREPLAVGTWRFIVSGDSRNCGDVVMPAIAADSALRYQPAFYWHLAISVPFTRSMKTWQRPRRKPASI